MLSVENDARRQGRLVQTDRRGREKGLTTLMMGIDGYSLRNSFNSAASNRYGPTPSDAELANAKQMFFDAIVIDNAEVTHRMTVAYPDAINWRDGEGLTGLMVAAKAGARNAAHALIAADAGLAAENVNGSTALMYAAFAGKAVVAEVLIKAGDDVNHANYEGHTPLMTAASHGFKNTLTLLLENGADPNMRNKSKLTALDYAEDNSYDDIAAILRERMGLPAKSAVKSGFDEVAPKAQDIPAPANTNEIPPDKQAVYDANETALKEMEQRMRKAKLF